MTHTESIDLLRLNWGRIIDDDRVRFFVSRLKDFNEEEVAMGVDILFDTQSGIPEAKDIKRCCYQARGRIKQSERKRRAQRRFKPGDVVDGDVTFTPDQAAAELVRVEAEFPECFDGSPPPPYSTMDSESSTEVRTAFFQWQFTRIYAKALRKCAALDPNIQVSAQQTELSF